MKKRIKKLIKEYDENAILSRIEQLEYEVGINWKIIEKLCKKLDMEINVDIDGTYLNGEIIQ